MKKVWVGILTASAFISCASVVYAKDERRASPQAGTRTYAQNYKDMVLATCIANAYRHDKDAAIDAEAASAHCGTGLLTIWRKLQTKSSHWWIVTWRAIIATRSLTLKSRASASTC